jgi:predicted DNA-binding WGR domain protein
MWEIRGLFGNEYAMEQAIEELKKHQGYQWAVLDRRNLSIRFEKRNDETEELVKRTLEMYHGFAEHEGPLGEYDRLIREQKEKKLQKEEKMRRAGK